MDIIFHVGMGKTGSTALQASLAAANEKLKRTGQVFWGPWLEFLRPEFAGFPGFQAFLRRSPEELDADADKLVAHLAAGHSTAIISNEQYLENIDKLSNFFSRISRAANLKVVIYIRPPAKWLPSAYAQWGIAHKTNHGAIEPFGVAARRLMEQYGFVRRWRETLGDAVMVRQYLDGMDIARDFGDALAIDIPSLPQREQSRLPEAELVLRAAFNNRIHDLVLPDVFNGTMPSLYSAFPVAVSKKASFLFDRDELPQILEEHTETISYLEDQFGLNLSDTNSQDGAFSLTDLSDALLGHLVDIVCTQARDISDLRERLARLEGR